MPRAGTGGARRRPGALHRASHHALRELRRPDPPARSEILPGVELCVSCQEDIERMGGR
ncbi:TraR/DksA C4-type zinc finger protein [Pseudomonas capeferrum]